MFPSSEVYQEYPSMGLVDDMKQYFEIKNKPTASKPFLKNRRYQPVMRTRHSEVPRSIRGTGSASPSTRTNPASPLSDGYSSAMSSPMTPTFPEEYPLMPVGSGVAGTMPGRSQSHPILSTYRPAPAQQRAYNTYETRTTRPQMDERLSILLPHPDVAKRNKAQLIALTQETVPFDIPLEASEGLGSFKKKRVPVSTTSSLAGWSG